MNTAYVDGWSAGYYAASHAPARCDIALHDPGDKYNLDIIKRSRKVTWATNNVERASRHFQYGVEWWIHKRLAAKPAATSKNASLAFIPAYFSYMHIFASHLNEPVLRAIAQIESEVPKKTRHIVAHTHPGTCKPPTRNMIRLLVDTDLCTDSRYPIAVPYVVAHPQWLVQPTLPQRPRHLWLFFRGHLPKSYFDRNQVRKRISEALSNVANVSVQPADTKGGASYETHDDYLEQMLRSRFCFAPRGDTSSSKRLYESIAAGCIPIIVSDKLTLPFVRQMSWESMSLRFDEAAVARDPMMVLRTVQQMPADKLAAMQRSLLTVRPMFLFHLDESRRSAVDHIIHELCAYESLK